MAEKPDAKKETKAINETMGIKESVIVKLMRQDEQLEKEIKELEAERKKRLETLRSITSKVMR
jgi:hypothetical protein